MVKPQIRNAKKKKKGLWTQFHKCEINPQEAEGLTRNPIGVEDDVLDFDHLLGDLICKDLEIFQENNKAACPDFDQLAFCREIDDKYLNMTCSESEVLSTTSGFESDPADYLLLLLNKTKKKNRKHPS